MDATGATGFGVSGPGTLHVNQQPAAHVALGQLGMSGNVHAGQSYKLGLDSKGRVVHIYSDGQRVTIVPHGAPKQALALTLFHQENQQAQHAAALQDVARQFMAAAHGLSG